MKEIKGFFGEYRFLSNFTPATIYLDGDAYGSVEHAYVAAKTTDPREREIIRMVVSPGKVKIVGRRLALRSDWDNIKVSYMKDFVNQKFNYQTYKDMLLATGDAYLEETNNWGDYFWGVCNGTGQNMLGKILMAKRNELRSSNP